MGNAAYLPCAVSRDKGAAQLARSENVPASPLRGFGQRFSVRGLAENR
jgi:hypothetical protein